MSKGGTIQSFIDSGDSMEAWCHNPRCRHHATLDFEKLKAKLGPDHGAMHDDLIHVLRCSKCGGKEMGFIRHAKGNDKRSGGPTHNTYARTKGG